MKPRFTVLFAAASLALAIARDGSKPANARHATLADGRKLFAGSWDDDGFGK